MSDSSWLHELQTGFPSHHQLPEFAQICISRAGDAINPLILWCPLHSFPASGSIPMSQLFVSGCQSIEVSASTSVLLMNIQDWFHLGLTGLISLQSRDLWRVFSNTTVQKYQFFGVQPFLWSNSHICIWHIDLTRQTSVSEVMSLFLICCLG